ncbi:MAG: patatin-like phospholipase family protein [Verrucomicrobiota bacterium]
MTGRPAEADLSGKAHGGLALSLASSHLGFHVHAGFLAALTKNGIRPGHIGAASSGAFVGGLYAFGLDPSEISSLLASRRMRRAFWEWRGPLRGFGMLANLAGFTGFLTGRKVANFLRAYLGQTRIENCKRAELSLAVTNLTRGESQIVREGPMVEYIVASCAVPGLFRGYKIDGELFWDGAVSDSSPFQHFLTDDRISSVLVHVVSHKEPWRSARPTVAWAFGQAHQIVADRFLELGLECGSLRGKRILALTTSVPKYGFWQRGTSEPLYEAGYKTVEENLENIRELL